MSSLMLGQYKYSDSELKELLNGMVILIDTREKQNEHITSAFEKHGVMYERRALKHGDYSFYLKANPALGIHKDLYFDKQIVVERKANLEEISQNFTKFRANLEKELACAPPTKVILIESNNYTDLVHHYYSTEYNPKSFLTSFHSFWHRYNCPMFFLQEKRDASIFIKYFFDTFIKELVR